jgi:hydrogenase nickel incorporation protein HypA/HybF
LHELSIAAAVVEIACRHAAGRPVRVVQIRVGRLRQVVPSALEFSFSLVADGTAVAGARLVIEDVPAVGRCQVCKAETKLESFPLLCGNCGGPDLEIVSGDELLVEMLELEEGRPESRTHEPGEAAYGAP